MNERDKKINNKSVYEAGLSKAIEIIMGWHIPHPTSHDANTQNIVVNEILNEIGKQIK